MSKNQVVSDEQLVAAIIASPTMTAAAESVGLNVRTLYSRMHTKAFRQLYTSAKSDIMKTTAAAFQQNVLNAVNTISDIMQNESTAPDIRLKAANMILVNAEKFTTSSWSLAYSAEQETAPLFDEI